MQISDLLTPCLLLDEMIMRRNIDRMQHHLTTAASTLRPHLKTSKCIEVAEAITRGRSRGITVSTLREAEYFGARGFSDILYSVAPPPSKLPHIAHLLSRGIKVMILADNQESVAAIIQQGLRAAIRIPVLLEIDCDGHRSGLRPEPTAVVPVAKALAESEGATFCGILTHAGGAYDCKGVAQIREAAAGERNILRHLANELAKVDLPCTVISVGSTPTATLGSNFSGTTEVRAGVFVFNDLTMVNLGVCAQQDIALSVLTSVIGHRPTANQIVTDAGWMALSADLSTERQAIDYRYGLVCDGLTGVPLDSLFVVGTNQEHGLVGKINGGPVDFKQFPINRLLRILPVHACATAAAHESYQVTEGPLEVVNEWKRFAGW